MLATTTRPLARPWPHTCTHARTHTRTHSREHAVRIASVQTLHCCPLPQVRRFLTGLKEVLTNAGEGAAEEEPQLSKLQILETGLAVLLQVAAECTGSTAPLETALQETKAELATAKEALANVSHASESHSKGTSKYRDAYNKEAALRAEAEARADAMHDELIELRCAPCAPITVTHHLQACLNTKLFTCTHSFTTSHCALQPDERACAWRRVHSDVHHGCYTVHSHGRWYMPQHDTCAPPDQCANPWTARSRLSRTSTHKKSRNWRTSLRSLRERTKSSACAASRHPTKLLRRRLLRPSRATRTR
jgi:hypothetical protein